MKLAFRTTLNVYTGHVPLVHGSKLGITIDGRLNVIIFSSVPDSTPTLLTRICSALYFVAYEIHSKIFQTVDIKNFVVFFILTAVTSL